MMKAMTLDFKDAKTYFKEISASAAKNWRIILLAMLFLCGLIAGTALTVGSGGKISTYAQALLEKMFAQPFSRNYAVLSAEISVLLAFIFISGLCAVGLPAILISPVLQGIIIGVICSYLYINYNIDGVIFTAIIIVPFCAISVLMLLIVCNEAAITSSGIVKAVLGVGENSRGEVKSYFFRAIIAFIVVNICTLLQAVCLTGFGQKLLA